MRKWLFFAYGLIGYASFLAAFLYAMGFVSGYFVPRTIDAGPAAATLVAVAINLGLLSAFAVQHSIMARPGFKRVWTRIVPPAIERSTFVLATSAIFLAIFTQWRPLPATVWDLRETGLHFPLLCVSALGWLTVLLASFQIDHFELFGLSPTWRHLRGKQPPQVHFAERGFYRHVRHPLMLGFLLAFWSTPYMTQGHLLFTGVVTAYILVALQLEERDLIAAHGDQYRDYRRRVPSLIPGNLFCRPAAPSSARPQPLFAVEQDRKLSHPAKVRVAERHVDSAR